MFSMPPAGQVFWFSAASWLRAAQFAVVGLGLFFSFVPPGLAHKILHYKFGFRQPVVFAFLQFLTITVMCSPYLVRTVWPRKPLAVPFSVYFLIALILTSSMVLDSYAAFQMNYSTELLFKYPKLIPVMLGNIVLLKRRLTLAEFVTTCVIVTGLVGVTLGDFVGRSEFDFGGSPPSSCRCVST
jgi:adenosine 3'-phospho 5'-phosphosulfate transporter B3